MSGKDTGTDAGDKVAGTAAFTKFMRILQLVADAPLPMTLTELCKASGFPRGTAYRTVYALMTEGLLAESALTGKIALGPRLLSLASQSWRQSDLRRLAEPFLAELRDRTGETVHLAVFDGTDMVFVDKLESPRAVQMSSRIGTKVALHSSSVGKAYLAFQPSGRRGELLAGIPEPWPALTPKTLRDKAALRRQLEQIRERGWAVDDEEQEDGIRCFGAPVFDRQGSVAACVSVTTLRYREAADPLLAYVEPLRNACQGIGDKLRGTP